MPGWAFLRRMNLMAGQGTGGGAGNVSGEPLPYPPLPGGLHDPGEAARTAFDHLAHLYDAARPGYPAEAIADLVTRCEIGPGSRVLEIGCGTGQATRDLARTGCSICCLEPGPRLAALARQNLASYPEVRVTMSTFEAAGGTPGCYDAVVSATAFHWIDPHTGYPKAARLLRPQGSLALLTNAHVSGGTADQIAPAIGDLHQRLAPEAGGWAFPSLSQMRQRAAAGGDIAAVWSRVERKLSDPPPVGHLFQAPAVSAYPWVASYDTDAYLASLSSQSAYALMDPGRRSMLLQAIGELIDDRLGGTLTKQYLTILATARRRG